MADGTQIRITAVDQTTAAFRSVQNNISSLQSSLRELAGPLAAAFSVASVTLFSKSLIDAADRLGEVSQKTGVAASSLSALSNAAKMNGVDVEGLGTAMVRLNRAISEATSGSKEQQKAFAAIGLSSEQLKNLSTEEVFFRISDAFASAEDGAGKTAIAMALLGKSGADLIPTLNMGRDELKKFSATFSDEFTSAANEFNDNIDKIIQSIKRIGADALTPVLNGLNKFVLYLRGIAKVAKEQGWWKTLLGMTEIGEWLGMGVSDKIIAETNAIVEAQSKAADKVKKKNVLSIAPDPEVFRISAETQKKFGDELKKLEKIFESTDPAVRKYYQSLKELQEISYMLFPDEILDRQMAIEEEFAKSQKTVVQAKSALQQYADTVLNLGANIQTAAIRSLGNLENSLTRVMMGTMTVKDAFRSMAISIIEDLIRIQIRRNIVGPIAQALDSVLPFGGGTATVTGAPLGTGITVPARAMGGSVGVGRPYMVGEKGPELFIPGKTGTIVPNNELGGSGAVVNQTINISAGVSQTVRAEIQSLLPRITEATKAAMMDAKRRGGSFGKVFA